jgi:hypothetical protein
MLRPYEVPPQYAYAPWKAEKSQTVLLGTLHLANSSIRKAVDEDIQWWLKKVRKGVNDENSHVDSYVKADGNKVKPFNFSEFYRGLKILRGDDIHAPVRTILCVRQSVLHLLRGDVKLNAGGYGRWRAAVTAAAARTVQATEAATMQATETTVKAKEGKTKKNPRLKRKLKGSDSDWRRTDEETSSDNDDSEEKEEEKRPLGKRGKRRVAKMLFTSAGFAAALSLTPVKRKKKKRCCLA